MHNLGAPICVGISGLPTVNHTYSEQPKYMTDQELRRQYALESLQAFGWDINKFAEAINIHPRIARDWVSGKHSPSPSVVRCIQLVILLKDQGIDIPASLG